MNFLNALQAIALSSAMTTKIMPDLKCIGLHLVNIDSGILGSYERWLNLIVLCPGNIWKATAKEQLDYDKYLVYTLAHEFRHAQQHFDKSLPQTGAVPYYSDDGVINIDIWSADAGEQDAIKYADDVIHNINPLIMLDISNHLIKLWRKEQYAAI